MSSYFIRVSTCASAGVYGIFPSSSLPDCTPLSLCALNRTFTSACPRPYPRANPRLSCECVYLCPHVSFNSEIEYYIELVFKHGPSPHHPMTQSDTIFSRPMRSRICNRRLLFLASARRDWWWRRFRATSLVVAPLPVFFYEASPHLSLEL